MIIRAILPVWAEYTTNLPKVQEGEFEDEKISELNKAGYNIYYLPNYPEVYTKGSPVDGTDITTFDYVFVDMDLKDNTYKDKQEFSKVIDLFERRPSMVVDSGNGIHAYWRVTDLDVMSYLKLQRRLCRYFKTDPAICKIYQLMRYPGTMNTKDEHNPKPCAVIEHNDVSYTCEEMSSSLPPITMQDEEYCQTHYNGTYKIVDVKTIERPIPTKFGRLCKQNKEVQDLFAGNTGDRSEGDFKLGQILFKSEFTKEEAMSVLVNCQKVRNRAPRHRDSYARNIVEKVYGDFDYPGKTKLYDSVKEILTSSDPDKIVGEKFPCYTWVDNTEVGFRLGHVIGLVAGSGVGKTAFALNMFLGFVESNPDYHHFVVPLEQTSGEIAMRWKTMCGGRTELYDKVHVISNYEQDGSFRGLSLTNIKNAILDFQVENNAKVGCVVIDHIGALKKKGKDNENQGLVDICHEMKSFAQETNTLLVMQSQTNREKAGIGDIELNKDAAFGTMYFEAYCDYLITMWQPLKRCYGMEKCPTVTAFKFCKIRHKKVGKDVLIEDTPYTMLFDPETEKLRTLTQDETTQFNYFNVKATNLRKQDRKTDLVTYTTIKDSSDGKPKDIKNEKRSLGPDSVSEGQRFYSL